MHAFSGFRLLLPLSVVLLFAGPAAAVPFDFQVYQNGDLLGTFGQTTSWLGCSEAGNTTSCASSDRTIGGLTLDSWSLFFDNDPVVSGTVALTNNQLVTQQFTLIFNLPVVPMGATLSSGSIQGGATDNNGNGATVAAAVGGFLYSAIVDGNLLAPFQTLHGDPFSHVVGPFDSTSIPSANFGFPNPPSAPGPFNPATIGIRLDFTLTPGDSASFTSNFVVMPVPEPTTGLLLGVGLAIALRRSRRA